MKQNLSCVSGFLNTDSVSKVPNLLEDDIQLEQSDIEVKLLSRNSDRETSVCSPVVRNYQKSYNDESLLDIQEFSNLNLLSKKPTFSTPQSLGSFVLSQRLAKNIKRIKKADRTNLSVAKFILKDKSNGCQSASNRLVLRTNQNITNTRLNNLIKRRPLAMSNNDLKRDISSMVSLDKSNIAKNSERPKVLTLGQYKRSLKPKGTYGLLSKRINAEKMISARFQELVGLLNSVEKLEAKDFSAERHLIGKCASMVKQKLL